MIFNDELKIELYAKMKTSLAIIDTARNDIIFEAEDNKNTGLLVFQTYMGNDKSPFLRRFYIVVVNGEIEHYRGVEEDENVVQRVSGEEVALKFLARSEYDRISYARMNIKWSELKSNIIHLLDI